MSERLKNAHRDVALIAGRLSLAIAQDRAPSAQALSAWNGVLARAMERLDDEQAGKPDEVAVSRGGQR